MKRSIVFITLILFHPIIIYASTLQTMFESLGANVNTTTPGAFQDQAAGYYTGGGVTIRQSSKTVQPITVSLPKIGMGCNKLDLYFGSFSYLKGQELVQLLRNVGTAVPTYAFQLAMKTMAPQVENLFAQIRKMAQDMNATMMNDCLMAQQLVGGLLPKSNAMSEYICKDVQGADKDWFNARKHCEKDNTIHASLTTAKDNSKDLLVGEYNLVWHILKKMDAYKNDPAFAEFIMTTVGTLISRKENDRFRLIPIEGKADQKEYLGSYLKGGEVEVFRCDESDKCLYPRAQKITIAEDATMSAKVLKRIQELRQRYIEGTAITSQDIAFLNDAVNVPIYRYIQVSAAVGSPFIMHDTAEYLAISILIYQFERLATDILEAVETLQKIQLDDSALSAFKKRVQETRSRLQGLLTQANINAAWRLEHMIKSYEQAIIAKNS